MYEIFGSERCDPRAICIEVTEALRAMLPEIQLVVTEDDPFNIEAIHPDENLGTLQLYLGNIVQDIQGV